MKNLISLTLLLAVAISCNGQAPPRPIAPRPVNPSNPAPSNPNSPPVRPVPPPRQQPGTAAPAPGRPAPAPQRPAPAPQAPPRTPPAPPAVRPPASAQNPQQGPTRATTTVAGGPTTRPPTTARPNQPNVSLPSQVESSPRPDVESFPTAPNIAPIPPVHFPTPNEPNMPNFPPMNGVQPPQTLPTNPNPRVGEGRPDARCPQFADPRNPVHLPHESNCANFYKCDHGMAFEYRCPNGQHWNAFRNYCDFPSNAGCQSGVVPRPQPLPQQPLPPTNNWNQNQPLPPTNNWNQNQPLPPTNNWNQNQPRNNNPGYEHPIVIPMAPRT